VFRRLFEGIIALEEVFRRLFEGILALEEVFRRLADTGIYKHNTPGLQYAVVIVLSRAVVSLRVGSNASGCEHVICKDKISISKHAITGQQGVKQPAEFSIIRRYRYC